MNLRDKILIIPTTSIEAYEKNAKAHPETQIDQIAKSIEEFGFNQPLVVDKDNVLIVGHGRFLAAKTLGIEEVPVIRADELTKAQVKAYRLADNKLNESGWDMKLVVEELKSLQDEDFDISLTGFTLLDIEREDFNRGMIRSTLAESFIIPPFSVWDTKQEYWQERKRMWRQYFGDSREGREDDLLGAGMKRLSAIVAPQLSGTSEFDPVVAEIAYRWFCPVEGTVIDPFSGGVVRGATASVCGLEYHGIDLSEKQVQTNRAQFAEITDKGQKTPNWHHGNSLDLDTIIPKNVEADFVFSCPPYYDLEPYNDGEGDLSMLGTYEEFIAGYDKIIAAAVSRLKDDRFACFVVGDIRDKQGYYRGFVVDTIRAFEKAGMKYYNDIVLLNAISTAPVRSKRPFSQNRKTTKVHQNILAFYKGNPENIKKSYETLPTIARHHHNVVVFYKGDIEEIKKNYQVVTTGLEGIEFDS